jgi:hypothetical protein
MNRTENKYAEIIAGVCKAQREAAASERRKKMTRIFAGAEENGRRVDPSTGENAAPAQKLSAASLIPFTPGAMLEQGS